MVNASAVQGPQTFGHRLQNPFRSKLANKTAMEYRPKISRLFQLTGYQPPAIQGSPNRLDTSAIHLDGSDTTPTQFFGDGELSKGSRRPGKKHPSTYMTK